MEDCDTTSEPESIFIPQFLPNLDFSNLTILQPINFSQNQDTIRLNNDITLTKVNDFISQHIHSFPLYPVYDSTYLENNFKYNTHKTNISREQTLSDYNYDNDNLFEQNRSKISNNHEANFIYIRKQPKRREKNKATTRAPYLKHRCKCWFLNLPATKHLYNGTPCAAEFCKLRTGFREQKNWKERIRVASLKERQTTLKLLLENCGFTPQRGRWTEFTILTTAIEFIRFLHNKIAEVRGISFIYKLLPFSPKSTFKSNRAKRDPNCFLKFSMYMRQEFKKVLINFLYESTENTNIKIVDNRLVTKLISSTWIHGEKDWKKIDNWSEIGKENKEEWLELAKKLTPNLVNNELISNDY